MITLIKKSRHEYLYPCNLDRYIKVEDDSSTSVLYLIARGPKNNEWHIDFDVLFDIACKRTPKQEALLYVHHDWRILRIAALKLITNPNNVKAEWNREEDINQRS